MATKKNNDNRSLGVTNEENYHETNQMENLSHENNTSGKRSAFNEESDLETNPPRSRRNPDAIEEGDEDYDDEETESEDYYEDVHFKKTHEEEVRGDDFDDLEEKHLEENEDYL